MPRQPRRFIAPPELANYQKQPGSSRRYELISNPSVTISRRDYLDAQARQKGWSDSAQYQAVSKAAGGLGGVGSPASQIVLGTMNRADIAPQYRRETARSLTVLLHQLARDPENKAHDGPLNAWLIAIGLKEQRYAYTDVGDTPRVGRK